MSTESALGSPMKKQRASVDALGQDRSAGFPSALGDVLGRATSEKQANNAPQSSSGAVFGPKDEDDEEL
jgi:hypothetical protein